MCENEFVATLELKQITEDQFSYTNQTQPNPRLKDNFL